MLGTDPLKPDDTTAAAGVRRWIVGIALLAALMVVAAAVLQQARTRTVGGFNRSALTLKAATRDLHLGVLNLWLAADADDGSPWGRNQGLALLAQAEGDLRALAPTLDDPGVDAELRRHFSVLRDPEPAGLAGRQPSVRMRQSLYALDQVGQRIDGAVLAQIAAARRRLDLYSAVLLLTSVVVIGGTAAGALRADRLRAAARERLRRNEQQYRSTLAAMAEAVVTFDAQGRLLVANPAAEVELGVSLVPWRDQFPALDWELCDEDGVPLPRPQRPLWRALKQGESVRGQVVGVRFPGRDTRWLSINAEPLRDGAAGAVRGAVLSLSDITAARRQAAELVEHRDHLESLVQQRTAALATALRERETADAFLRMVTDTLPGRVVYWDMARRCRFANAQTCRRWQLPAEAVLGRSMVELMGEAHLAGQATRLDAAYGGEPQVFERDEWWPDGTPVTMQVRYVPDVPDPATGQVRGLLVLATDVTALKKAGEELAVANAALAQRADDAEAATRAKSAFLANMSHEIRTPMNAILGLTHLIARDSSDPLQQDRLHKVDGAARHLLQLINDVLDLSKVEAGRRMLCLAPFSREALLRRTVGVVAAQAEEKGLALDADVQALPADLMGDEMALAQCLINLLGNAVKFTAQGRVALRADVVARHPGRLLVRFVVSDTGPGVEAALLPKVFEAFEQGDASLARQHGGTGLGLALTRQLARMMGGEAGADSVPGTGGSFWFTAWLEEVSSPAVDAPAISVAPADAEGPLRQLAAGRRVLVAEDNPINQEVACALLERVGLQVVMAQDGEEAVRTVLEGGFDLVLMDVHMPKLDGLAATRALRDRLGPGLPIIAMTANAFADDRQACLDAGMDDHLSKPVEMEVLYRTLVRWLAPAGGTAVGGPPPPEEVTAGTLRRIDGLDVDAALRNLGEQPQLVARVLRRFAAQYRQGLPLLRGLPAGVSRPALAAACHAVRGACATIGTLLLAGEIDALEQKLQQPDADIDALATAALAVDTGLQELAAQIDAVLGP